MEKYLSQVQALGYKFIELLALARFYDSDELMQHRGKVGLLPLTCYLHDCIRV
jgi:hypothetical protein